MHNTTTARSVVATLALLAATSLEIAYADVTIEERITVQGAGALSMANMSGTTVRSVSGNRAREDSHIQIESRLVRFFARGAASSGTAQLIRLDEDKVYSLDLGKKQYTEISLAEKRAQLQKAMSQVSESRAQPGAPSGMDESQCEWSDPKVEVKRTGLTATIGGFSAEQTTIVASQSCTDRKTGSVCDVGLLMDLWLAPGVQGIDEATQFNRAYAERMGFAGTAPRDATQRVEAMFSRYKAWEQASGEMQGLKGYPVRSSFALGFGGPQCKGAQTSGTEAAQSSPPSEANVQQSVATSAGQSAGESAAAGTGFGGLAGQLGGKLVGGLFGRKSQASQSSSASAQSAASSGGAGTAASAADPLSASGMVVPLRYTIELVSISSQPVSADTFEVPADFKKVQAPGR